MFHLHCPFIILKLRYGREIFIVYSLFLKHLAPLFGRVLLSKWLTRTEFRGKYPTPLPCRLAHLVQTCSKKRNEMTNRGLWMKQMCSCTCIHTCMLDIEELNLLGSVKWGRRLARSTWLFVIVVSVSLVKNPYLWSPLWEV